jgi:hypothetical protein
MCNDEMEYFESNNPEPLMENIDENRVCRDCNDFVTATRFVVRSRADAKLIFQVLSTAFSLRVSRKQAMDYFLDKLEEE